MLNNYRSSPSLTNVTISGNNASNNGGAMYNYNSSSPSLTNVTISGNNASNNGGAMFNNYSSPTINKSIIWNNSSHIWNTTDSIPVISNSLILDSKGSGTNWVSSIGIDKGGNVDVDPLFVDPKDYHLAPTVEGDYRLRPESPAIPGGMGAYELTIAEIPILNNLTVAYGTDLISANLPTDVSVTMNDQTTQSLQVTWDGGNPSYNGNVAGDYDFLGTLVVPFGVTNPKNLKAVVKVTVEPKLPQTYYVKVNGSGNKDGSSWANAFDSLQTALEAAQAGDQILIAEGTYYPTKATNTSDDRTKTFQMKNGVAIYGGFTGNDDNETVETRDWTTNKTILSGDLGKNDDTNDSNKNKEDNAYQVFYHHNGINLDKTAKLDGVSIIGGNATGMNMHAHGGAMFNNNNSPSLTNVTISGNSASLTGGAMFNNDSSPSLTNVIISGNDATYDGGGMFNQRSSPSLTNVTISGNNASRGGAMNNHGSSPSLTNVTISGNNASIGGGAMFNNDSSPSLTNVTISGNIATYTGGGMYNNNSNPAINKSIIWGNSSPIWNGGSEPEFSKSLIQDSKGSGENWVSSIGKDDGGNVDVDPLFADPKDYTSVPTVEGDYHLRPESPAITEGMGAYEFTISKIAILNNLTVSYGTDLASVNLPTGVSVTLSDGTTPNIPVIWDNGTPTYDENVSGDYEFKGTLTLPANVGNPTNLEAEVKVIVEPTKITSIDSIADLSVAYGTDLASLNLPMDVSVTLSDGTTPNIPIVWDNGTPTYDGNVAGDYEFKGTLTLPANVGNPDNHKAEVKVIVEPTKITSIDSIADLSVVYGTDLANANLPTAVSVTLSDGTTPNIPVVWDNGTPTYDGNVSGDYLLKGTLTLPANVGNPDNHKAEVKVIVEPAKITSIDSITDLPVAYGTDLASVNLPKEVNVTLSDGTTPNIPVIWDNGTPTYDGNVAGDYEFKGTLDLPSNVANPDNHNAGVKVQVLPKPTPPSPPTLYPEATLTVDQPLTEDQLDGSKITIRVSDTYFMNTLVPEHIELHNAPKGLGISNVERINSTTAIITFTFDGKKLDKAYDLGLTIQSAGLTTWYNMKADNTIHIEKSEGPPYKVIIKEGTFEPTKVWTVTLSGEVDAATVQDALYTEDEVGTRIPVTFTSDGMTIFINPPAGNYLDGSYTLYITRKLKDKNGNELKEPIKMIFTIKSQEEPEIEENYKLITKEGVFEPTKVWALQLSSEVDPTTVQDALYVEDELGTRIPTTFTSDGKNIFIEPTAGNYEDGTYTLYITSKLKDKDGNSLKEPIKMVFTIKFEGKPEVLKEYALSSDETWDLYLLMED